MGSNCPTMTAETADGPTGTSDREGNRADRNRRGAIGLAHVALILGVVGMALGASGLAIALAHSGAAGTAGAKGDTGAQGSQGPAGNAGAPGVPGATGPAGSAGAPGPGAIVNVSNVGFGNGVNATACEPEPGADVGLSAGRAGTVVVTATVSIYISHTNGTRGDVSLVLGDSSTGCSGQFQFAYVNNAQPTGPYYITVGLVGNFPVTSSGTYTYSLYGENIVGPTGDPADFFSTTIVGEFYPA
jgi:hypothetical protein